MNRVATTCAFLVAWLTLFPASATYAAESEGGTSKVPADPVAAELHELGLEYERVANAQTEALTNTNDATEEADDTISDEEWLKQGQAQDAKIPDPDRDVLPRLFDFAKSHPDSPFAFDALLFVIRRGGPQTGDVHGKPWQLKEQALDVAWADHENDPRMLHLLEALGGTLPSQKTESFLKRAMESDADRSVQAAAAFNLARYYRNLHQVHQRSRKINDKPHLLNFERFWKIVITAYVEKNFPLDEEKNAEQLEQLLAVVIEEYPDVPTPEFETTGPARIFVKTLPSSTTKTYADRAKALLFEYNNIVPGKSAPAIEGTDADGKSFRLSDYRGNVVLLTFSANWCGGCVELYPMQRSLLEKFRDQPFVILSVSRDEKIDTLKTSIASGEINWRCWWDGYDGPIRERWNCRGIPDLFLLDRDHIIQDAHITRFSSQQEFEQAIESLLQKAPANENPKP